MMTGLPSLMLLRARLMPGCLTLLLALTALSLAQAPASAERHVRYGVLSCDISAGIGLIFTEKQTMNCLYTPDDGSAPRGSAPTTLVAGLIAPLCFSPIRWRPSKV
jgi:hypothetical protein